MVYHKHAAAVDVYIDTPPSECLSVVNYGHEKCVPSFRQTASERDYTMLLFVSEGEGYISTQEKAYSLRKGMAFAIFPGMPVSYGNSDPQNPMSLSWIGFAGKELLRHLPKAGFSPEQPVRSCACSRAIEALLHGLAEQSAHATAIPIWFANSVLYRIIQMLTDETPDSRTVQSRSSANEPLVQRMIRLMNDHYPNDLGIEELAVAYRVSRSNLWRSFKRATGLSPHEYLTEVRIGCAKKLLRTQALVKDVAASCGFQDPYYFSRVFKTKTGLSPQEYMRAHCGRGKGGLR